jgi:hypothetical protein
MLLMVRAVSAGTQQQARSGKASAALLAALSFSPARTRSGVRRPIASSSTHCSSPAPCRAPHAAHQPRALVVVVARRLRGVEQTQEGEHDAAAARQLENTRAASFSLTPRSRLAPRGRVFTCDTHPRPGLTLRRRPSLGARTPTALATTATPNRVRRSLRHRPPRGVERRGNATAAAAS